ncbi:hypothetical protein [Algisphaera agarilytica]|uniref:Uncharacterized protein n=1 Tax=Algisphaera agarilytica TaxID=1385975 RepID=A0A7X0H607_9BACT|nr:hypothetical protein [Algisphaera agarilytica]MBB6429941.1 hypothetical protein [Algisphaera agarilytica]
MHQTLKLTITAVGEPDSIFLVPCEPITLHESEIDDGQESTEAEAPAETGSAFLDAADALATPEVMILADEPPLPASHRRRAS